MVSIRVQISYNSFFFATVFYFKYINNCPQLALNVLINWRRKKLLSSKLILNLDKYLSLYLDVGIFI